MAWKNEKQLDGWANGKKLIVGIDTDGDIGILDGHNYSMILGPEGAVQLRDWLNQHVPTSIAAANRAEALQESAESLASKVQRLLNWREDKSPYTREYCEDKVRQAIQHLELVVKEQLPLPAAPKEVNNG